MREQKVKWPAERFRVRACTWFGAMRTQSYNSSQSCCTPPCHSWAFGFGITLGAYRARDSTCYAAYTAHKHTACHYAAVMSTSAVNPNTSCTISAHVRSNKTPRNVFVFVCAGQNFAHLCTNHSLCPYFIFPLFAKTPHSTHIRTLFYTS